MLTTCVDTDRTTRDLYDDCVGATSIILPPGGYGGRLRQSPTQPPRPPWAPSVQPSVASPFTNADIAPSPSNLPPAAPEPTPSFAVGGGSTSSPFESADSATIALSMPGTAPHGGAAPLEETGSAGPLEQIGSELPIMPQSQVEDVAYYQHAERFLGAFRGLITLR